jgi:hypothetical protein
LMEMASTECLARTKANVVDSDATVIFTYGPLLGGSLKTATYANHLEKPYHDVDLKSTPRKKAVKEIMCWLSGDTELNDYEEYQAGPSSECILNVARSRESHTPGIQDMVFHLSFIVKTNDPNNQKWL